MAISMKSMILLVFCALMSRQSYAETTGEEWCKTEKPKYSQFRIKHAVRVGQYIGMRGELMNPNNRESEMVTIRSLYWHQPDPSNKTQYNYYSASLWPDLDLEMENVDPYYVMSVRHIKILENVSDYETILLIGSKSSSAKSLNRTIALTFDYSKVEKLENASTVYTVNSRKVIYDPSNEMDNSDSLSFKFFLAHFPDSVQIKAVFAFDLKSGANEITHCAIVYTEEEFEGKRHYFRQYMKSVRTNSNDDNSQFFLVWSYDERQEYCDSIDTAPDAVVLMRDESSDESQDIYFLEFYDTRHQLMKLTYTPGEHYSVESVGSKVFNFISLLHCEPHLLFVKVDQILCKNDYSDPNEQSVDDEGTASTIVHWIAILTTIAAIVGLIAVVIYSIVANNQKDPK